MKEVPGRGGFGLYDAGTVGEGDGKDNNVLFMFGVHSSRYLKTPVDAAITVPGVLLVPLF